MYTSHIKNDIIIIINFVGRQVVTVNNYIYEDCSDYNSWPENQHRYAVQNAAISVSSHMFEFKL